ncbi:MAG: GGDEF domain-containing protein [Candidatus Marinimicrobia bacterium]|nr:GGDEF domain-containing protein [Candidatus Neomarinimicrobiota bacterium]MCF7830268.1 GGDEF domain-containing protein [Candidatus Neomarinimicrobiota bacterium]MCF7882177.1 GGDEF domain-containing protein [Candidatus Neomarinimicrobiota bacterium]
MPYSIASMNPEIQIQTLNYAARQISSELDMERLVMKSLDTVADFSSSTYIGMFSIKEEEDRYTLIGLYRDGEIEYPDEKVKTQNTLLEKISEKSQIFKFPLDPARKFPYPSDTEDTEMSCLCLPLVGAHNQHVGIITLALPEVPEELMAITSPLRVLSTIIAVATENARLFNLATIDGLTGLYVRRYFDIRLREEVSRLTRQAGKVAILITDIDHFKQVNDTHGHQKGDEVLRELANLFQDTARQDIDIICRYGGEEFVIIMPDTGVEGAKVFSERLRKKCEHHPFPGNDTPLSITFSGGIAATDNENLLDTDELVRRADKKLYEAKEAGRNQIKAWEE